MALPRAPLPSTNLLEAPVGLPYGTWLSGKGITAERNAKLLDTALTSRDVVVQISSEQSIP